MDDESALEIDFGATDGPAAGLEAAPVSLSTVLPKSVRASSQSLGWWPLNVERRELEPDKVTLPGGTVEHVIFVTLAEAHYVRQGPGGLSEHDLEIGHMSIHPARRPVQWEWDAQISTINLTLDPQFLDEVASNVFGQDPTKVELLLVDRERDPVVSNIATQLLRELMQVDNGSAVVARALAQQLAVHLMRNYVRHSGLGPVMANGQWPRAVCAAVGFIDGAYAREITLADIAQAAHVSPFHLSRLFKKSMGMTPHQYLTRTRVECARALLAAGSRSLAEVAGAVGFADQSHLTRQFKRLLGTTPGQVQGH